jgi:Fe-S-cluster containining protein
MMCCKVPYIEEFDKAPGQWCAHAVPGRGCGIYENRPTSCRAFFCSWMLDPAFGPEWKPDRAKFVVYLQRNGVHLQVAVDPSFPSAWTKSPYHARIRQWAREGAEVGRFVFVRIGQRMIAVLPDREVDIGVVGLRDEIVVSRKPGPAGLVYDVVVQRAPARPLDVA